MFFIHENAVLLYIMLQFNSNNALKPLWHSQSRWRWPVHLQCQESTSIGDYHEEIDGVFTKWLNQKLIPNLPLHTVVVIDNAP
jgi:hypothetical protein